MQRISLLFWFVCAIQTLFIFSGLWPYTPESRGHQNILEGLTTLSIVAIAGATWYYFHMYKPSRVSCVRIAKLMTLGVIFCAIGDVINFNLGQQFHSHDPQIKHDYLVDSIYSFSIGYGLILYATVPFLQHLSITKKQATLVTSLVSLCTLLSYYQMRLPDTGLYVTLLAGFYALLVAQCSSFAILILFKAISFQSLKLCILPVIGLFLATLADALIGQFWLFGNSGQGYFPLIRTINWFIYISSSILIIQLPWVYHQIQSSQFLSSISPCEQAN
ncbi:hypothetical protein [Pseudoalteromonas luteoviolacea]|uniref:hypothetical protein n=1 Tax=Pseudoalteromonas luteoviolacea TaxID=43657 RepID=UPI0011514C65|nr:hypothetical protein [Pseudoalteromonas luteoviolacea]TQF67966.1 hypothetical protein FLM44_22595 [Pseudoalteromonas luteoviolacea]